MPKLNDLKGKRFGRLTVIERVGTSPYKKPLWLCQCDCGNTTIVVSPSLINGVTKSCGCLHQEKLKEGNKKHGLRYSRVYKIYVGILQRTTNEKNPDYHHYGGRGITVCEEWREDFQAFYDWAMANGYRDDLTLDRRDNDGPYSPDNCRWATQKEQTNNTRSNRLIEYQGVTRTLSEWAVITGIPSSTITARIDKLKWSVEKALETPVRKGVHHA